MPWGLWSSPSSPAASGGADDGKRPASSRNNNNYYAANSSNSSRSGGRFPTAASDVTQQQQQQQSPSPSHLDEKEKNNKRPVSWNESLNATDWQHYREVRNWVPTIIATATALGLLQFYRSYLRRIPGSAHIAPGFFRRRSLLGRVTSVGDGDNFHLFHTPGGRLAGWGWLRRVPTERKELKGRTIPIRIAGIDAPEGAHFGRPAQPGASEALTFLQGYVQGRRVRAYIYKRDQYERVVATVYVRQPPFFIPRRDVGLEMIRRGLATTYEAKTGAEFGGPITEARYNAAMNDARRKRRGIWAALGSARAGGGGFSFFGLGGGSGEGEARVETPREFKDRMRALDKAREGKVEGNGKKGP